MDDLATERSFDSQDTRVTDVLGLFLVMADVLVQELNVCTVRSSLSSQTCMVAKGTPK